MQRMLNVILSCFLALSLSFPSLSLAFAAESLDLAQPVQASSVKRSQAARAYETLFSGSVLCPRTAEALPIAGLVPVAITAGEVISGLALALTGTVALGATAAANEENLHSYATANGLDWDSISTQLSTLAANGAVATADLVSGAYDSLCDAVLGFVASDSDIVTTSYEYSGYSFPVSDYLPPNIASFSVVQGLNFFGYGKFGNSNYAYVFLDTATLVPSVSSSGTFSVKVSGFSDCVITSNGTTSSGHLTGGSYLFYLNNSSYYLSCYAASLLGSLSVSVGSQAVATPSAINAGFSDWFNSNNNKNDADKAVALAALLEELALHGATLQLTPEKQQEAAEDYTAQFTDETLDTSGSDAGGGTSTDTNNAVLQSILNMVSTAASGIGDVLGELRNISGQFENSLHDALDSFGADVLNPALDALTGTVTGAIDGVKTAVSGALAGIDSLVSSIAATCEGILDALPDLSNIGGGRSDGKTVEDVLNQFKTLDLTFVWPFCYVFDALHVFEWLGLVNTSYSLQSAFSMDDLQDLDYTAELADTGDYDFLYFEWEVDNSLVPGMDHFEFDLRQYGPWGQYIRLFTFLMFTIWVLDMYLGWFVKSYNSGKSSVKGDLDD